MKKFKFDTKIRVKITSSMILCSLILALLISFISIFVNYRFFKKEINEKLTLLPRNYSNNFNSDFKMVESSVTTLKHSISASFDLEKFNSNSTDYVNEYEKILDYTIKKSAETLSTQTTNRIQATYFTINPELTGEVYEIWYVNKAAKLQRQCLQNDFPSPDKVNLDVLYVASKAISGDFYHLEKTNDNKAVGILWDVCGKGGTAALSISAFNILFNRTIQTTQNPIEIINCLNTRVNELLGDTYVAAFCFSFDFEKKEAKIAGAGINEFMYIPKKENYLK